MAEQIARPWLRLGGWVSVAVLSMGALSCASIGRSAAGGRAEIKRAVAKVKPALVRVSIVEAHYYRGRENKYETSGSGVIVTSDGHVVTNHHVAGTAKRIVCTLADKRELDAELVGTDPLSDLAVIKLRGNTGEEFPFAEFGDSSTLKTGDRVMAMGSPMSLSQTVTLGIISNLEMIMPNMDWPYKFTIDGENVGSLVKWIGHDAAIFGGNSGGPLVDMTGRIVGINEIRMGLSGAIPADTARQVAEEIIRSGYVTRSWTGIEIQPLLKGSKRTTGAPISGTIEGSPAAGAGIESGDILLEFAGVPVTVEYAEELPAFTKLETSLPVGSEIEVLVLRDDTEKTFTLKTVKREKVMLDKHEFKKWGVVVTNISLWKQKEMKRDSRDGVLIFSVRPGGPCDAAKPNVREKDVIVRVGDEPVRNVEELAAITERITAAQTEPTPVLVAFERKAEELLTVVEVGLRELRDPGLEASKAWLPVETQVLTKDLAETLGVPGKTGVRVTRILPGAGDGTELEVGDLIVGLDGGTIPASQPEDTEVLPTMIRQYRIGAEVELDVIRGGEEIKATVKLSKSPKLAREMKKFREDNFEFTVRDVAFLDRAQQQWPADKQGVLVQEVAEGGLAALGHLAVGDLLLEIEGQPTTDVKSVRAFMEKINEEEPEYVQFKVLRGIHTRYVELEPDWEQLGSDANGQPRAEP
jgi:serine protease Do